MQQFQAFISSDYAPADSDWEDDSDSGRVQHVVPRKPTPCKEAEEAPQRVSVLQMFSKNTVEAGIDSLCRVLTAMVDSYPPVPPSTADWKVKAISVLRKGQKQVAEEYMALLKSAWNTPDACSEGADCSTGCCAPAEGDM